MERQTATPEYTKCDSFAMHFHGASKRHRCAEECKGQSLIGKGLDPSPHKRNYEMEDLNELRIAFHTHGD